MNAPGAAPNKASLPSRQAWKTDHSVPRHAISHVSQQTWYIDDARRPTAIDALQRVRSRHAPIETATMYADGESVAGEAIARRSENVFIACKVLPNDASLAGKGSACERSRACPVIGWTAISGTGSVRTRSRRPSPH